MSVANHQVNGKSFNIEDIAKLSPKEFYDFHQEISRQRGLPAWTTWEEYYEIIDNLETK